MRSSGGYPPIPCSVKHPRVAPVAAISRAIPSTWSVLERTAPTFGSGLATAIWISLMGSRSLDHGPMLHQQIPQDRAVAVVRVLAVTADRNIRLMRQHR